jgi:hypothetical protein
MVLFIHLLLRLLLANVILCTELLIFLAMIGGWRSCMFVPHVDTLFNSLHGNSWK